MKAMNEKELTEYLHKEVTELLTGEVKMSQTDFCLKSGIKSTNTLYKYLKTKELSGHTMIGKLIKGLGLTITYTITVNRG
jgi:predicted transcriptional regulator